MFRKQYAAPESSLGEITASPEPPFRLIGLAILWFGLALVAVLVADIAVTLAIGNKTAVGQGLSSVATALAFYAVLLWAAIRRGRVAGGGDLRTGFGDGPVSNLPLVVLLGMIASASVVLVVADHYYGYLQSPSAASTPEKGLWVHVFDAGIMVFVAPLVEELWFRGWLWTGLRKHWSAAATNAVTMIFFIVVHVPTTISGPFQYGLAAILLTFAREFGGSIRASIAVHMIWNLTTVAATAAFVMWGGRG